MYFPQVTDALVGMFRSRTAEEGAREARVAVTNGLRKVEVHPLGREGSYVREVHVYGASRKQILDALPGPATGPNGFAPDMVSVTPVSQQFHADRTTRAEQMRLPGLPASLGATVSGKPTPSGMAFKMEDGITTGGFTIAVGPEERLADGRRHVVVTEAGHFSIFGGMPGSWLGMAASAFANFTPMGWMMRAAGGAAVSDAHITIFELEAVLRKRLQFLNRRASKA
ncbi:MAG: hypothetical protein JWM80_5388 [Cyanobacteria bacterium RYN_339]|nr:hypothetical protein [Cyanobacteria bacterium RYN_339]